MSTLYESTSVEGVDIVHTFRGHRKQVEVYTFQSGPKTYSLFKRKGDTVWRCDCTASYNHFDIDLKAEASDEQAMLKAFASMLKETENL